MSNSPPTFKIPERPLPLGHGLLPLFQFLEGHRELNHGSFGTYPRDIHNILLYYRLLAERRPDHFNRQGFKEPLDTSRAAIAKLLNVPTDEVVFVANATTGVNTVLRALTWSKNDVILSFSTIYGACGRTISYVVDTTLAENYVVNLSYPMKNDEVIDGFKQTLKRARENGKNVKLAVFDVVSSLPGVRMPFERLVEECRREGILSLVDGAHGVGHVKLDLGKLKPDFFVSNCHKWLYSPRGCAVFHVPLRNQHLITTSIPTSHYYIPKSSPPAVVNPLGPTTKSNFVTQFEFNGTIDASQMYCVASSILWRQHILGGEDRILSYCHSLASRGGSHVAKALGTEVMTVDKSTYENGACCFANVRLPINVSKLSKEEIAMVDAYFLKVWYDYDTFMPCVLHNGSWWVRLGAPAYLDDSDFEWAAKVLKEVCGRVNDGSYKKSVLVGTPKL